MDENSEGLGRFKKSINQSKPTYNPFRPGNGIELSISGRQDKKPSGILRARGVFEEGLPRNFIIFGSRRTGKTELVNLFCLL